MQTHCYCAGCESGGVAFISRLFTMCVSCCVQRQGMLSHCAWSCVVSRWVGMGCGVLSGNPILGWRGVLGWWERLGHGFRGSWGLLVALQGKIQIGDRDKEKKKTNRLINKSSNLGPYGYCTSFVPSSHTTHRSIC